MTQAPRVDVGWDKAPEIVGRQLEADQEGVVVEVLPRALFVVELGSARRIVAHLTGHPRRNFVRVMSGDRVVVSLSPRDRTRGRIVRRLG